MKVWHLTKLSGGGAGQYALRLSRALRAEGVESAVLIAEGEVLGGADLLISEPSFLRSSATRAWVGILRRATTAAAFHTGFRLSRWQPMSPIRPEDIVHLHGMTGWIGFGGLEAMIPAGTRVFWTAHDLWMMSGGCVVYTGCEKFRTGCQACPLLKLPFQRISRLEFLRKSRFMAGRSVIPIANSGWTAEKIRGSSMFPHAANVPIVPPIVDDTCFAPTEETCLREELGISRDRHIIGLGARALTDPLKGIPEFLEHLARVPELARRVTVLIFGEGKLSVAGGLDCRFLGPVADASQLARIYRACDIFISPSRMETFGMTFLEAQACGTPVAGFRVGGVMEAVWEGDENNFVPGGDMEALLKVMNRRLGYARESDGLAAGRRNWVAKKFSAAKVARLQLAAYAGTT